MEEPTISEQESVLQAIKIAFEIELDGKECYLAASKGSTNQTVRKLLIDVGGQFKGDVF